MHVVAIGRHAAQALERDDSRALRTWIEARD
jgi:hypothetical protein